MVDTYECNHNAMVNNWSNIPKIIKDKPFWNLAESVTDKKPLTIINGSVVNASPIAGPWLTFEEATAEAIRRGMLIGFTLKADQNLTCIDCDVADGLSRDKNGQPLLNEELTKGHILKTYESIFTMANSYSEFSVRGSGLHIWVEGAIGKGRRNAELEIYSQERFIIMTGSVVSAFEYERLNCVIYPKVTARDCLPIKNRQSLLDTLVAGMRSTEEQIIGLAEIEPVKSDHQINTNLFTYEHRNRYLALCKCNGKEVELPNGKKAKDFEIIKRSNGEIGYPSLSEIDLAVLSILAFFSKSNEQCRRLFKDTELGKRFDGRVRVHKTNRLIDKCLRVIRSREQREAESNDMVNLKAAITAMEIKSQRKAEIKAEVNVYDDTDDTDDTESYDNINAYDSEDFENFVSLEWPPGVVGEIAQYIYSISPRKVPEVSITAALGLMAGITGKAYHTAKLPTGLNLYLILIARSAIGKETLQQGITIIQDQIRKKIPAIDDFINFDQFASSPALLKTCANKPCFINIAGEFGRKLKIMADEKDKNIQQLRTTMTDLYQKSGPYDTVGGLSYSDKDKNVKSMGGVSYSLMGESTPGVFTSSLTPGMMEDGFLSRFIMVNYGGLRDYENEDAMFMNSNGIRQYHPIPATILAVLANLTEVCVRAIKNKQYRPVSLDETAQTIFDAYDYHLDNKINSTKVEAYRQMWNRAHLKALRVACILAVADNCAIPVVNEAHAKWAIGLINTDMARMTKQISSGDIGRSDDDRVKKIMSFAKKYLRLSTKEVNKFNNPIDKELHAENIIPRAYFQQRCSIPAFKEHKLGSKKAFEDAMQQCIDNGYIVVCDKDAIKKQFNKTGFNYKVADMPSWVEG